MAGACPGHPDHMARPCPNIGVAGTSPAMTACERRRANTIHLGAWRLDSGARPSGTAIR